MGTGKEDDEGLNRRGGGGRWESWGDKMGFDEWRETGRELEKIGLQRQSERERSLLLQTNVSVC